MKALRIGVIGLGDIAHAYLSNLQKYPDAVELYACACRTPAKAQAKKEEYGFEKLMRPVTNSCRIQRWISY